MVVFISDLHFVDGSAGEHNVPVDAFRIFFEDISGTVNWLVKKGREVKEIKIVFLGDVFDLLRTEKWFDYHVNERPWGNDEAKIEAHANHIFDAIIKKNKKTFELLGSDLKDEFSLPAEPDRIYVPGNHDRICNKYKSLRDKVCQSLGLPPRTTPFEHHFLDIDYGVHARHGHEYDKFNYEGSTSYQYEDYIRMPIGDPLTTELVAKLPWKIMGKPEIKKLPKTQRKALERNLQEIENVRPFSAILEWLLYQVKKNLSLKEIIEDAVDEIIKEFNKLQFIEKWYEHHDKWYDFWDEGDKIQSVLFLLEKFKVFPSEKLMPLLEKVKNRFARDDLLEAALDEYSQLDNRIRYVVYGHTHVPVQVPLRTVEDPAGSKEHMYLNTGTWRTGYYKCKEGLGFTGWKNLTYLVFYRKEERKLDFPTFETWTGTLKSV